MTSTAIELPPSPRQIQDRLRIVLRAIARSTQRLDDLVESETDDAELVEAHATDVRLCGDELALVLRLVDHICLPDDRRTTDLLVSAGHALHELELYPLPPRGRDDLDRLTKVIARAVQGADGAGPRRAIWRLLSFARVTGDSPLFVDRERIVDEGTPGPTVEERMRRLSDRAWADLVHEHGPLTFLAALLDEGGSQRVEQVAQALDPVDHPAANRLRRLGGTAGAPQSDGEKGEIVAKTELQSA